MKIVHLNYLVAATAIAAIFASLLHFDVTFIVLKPLTTILILIVAVKFQASNRSKIGALTIVALLACLAGDVFLLNDDNFVFGLAAFLVAQCLFAFIFYSLAGGRLFATPFLLLMLFGGGAYYMLLPKLDNLAIPVAVYISCILIMCWQGINIWLARRDRTGQALSIAAVLFVFSDSIIAVDKFLLPFDLSVLLILASYWLSIAMIANIAAATRHTNGRAISP